MEYTRSVSLPARELRYRDESRSQATSQNGNETGIPDRSRSDSAISRQESLKVSVNSSCGETVSSRDQTEKVKDDENKHTSREPDVSLTKEPAGGRTTTKNGGSAGSALTSPELEVPKKFHFSGSSGDNTGQGLSEQESNEQQNDRSQTEEGVFVFTATTASSSSNPSSPDYVKSKRKNAGVSFNLLPQEIVTLGEGEGEGEGEVGEKARDEMAVLAQQLELGGSDNVS